MATLISNLQSRAMLGAVLRNGLAIPGLLMALLAMMILPLPPVLLDVLFTFNISLSIVVLLASVYSRRPLDFAAFPTVLLAATLLRLALAPSGACVLRPPLAVVELLLLPPPPPLAQRHAS